MRQKTIFLFVLVFSSIFISHAQQSGRIYLRDGSVIEVSEFIQLRSELYYFQRTFLNRQSNRTSIDFIREYPLEKIREISLRYEKGKNTGQFFYQLSVEGVTSDGSGFKKKIKTWDWLEMSTPESGSSKDMAIVFFTEKKKLDFVKIEFDK